MSRYSHPLKHTPEQVLHMKRPLITAKRTPTGRLGHNELARIAGETGVSKYMITMIGNGTYWAWPQEPAE